jgi:hypothetical protein
MATVSVDAARPLSAAVEALEKRYGWVVTYEDPALVYAGDIKDVTWSVRKNYDEGPPRFFGVVGGPFDFSYTIPADARGPNEMAVLGDLLDAYHASAYPGVFGLVRTGPIVHVVPTMRKNVSGELEAQSSLLDTRISLTDADRTAYEALIAIVEAVSDAAGADVGPGVGPGMVPTNLFLTTRVRVGAKDEPARTVLLRLLDATSTQVKLSWKLLRDQTPPGMYALNIHWLDTGESGLTKHAY